MTKPTVLILSVADDAHLPFVGRHLPRSSAVILGPEAFIKGTTLSYMLDGTAIRMVYGGVPLDNIQSVWQRKPFMYEGTHQDNEIPIAEGYKEYVRSGLRKHFLEVYGQFQHAFWLSDYYAIEKAGSKTMQLTLAKRLGFTVPETVATSDVSLAAKFLQKHVATIIKPLSRHGFAHQFFASTRIRRGELVDLTNLALAPCFFQQAVENIVADIRVTVVANQVFAAALTNPGLRTERTRDWRVGHTTGTLVIRPHTLPKPIAQKCIDHCQELGLQFGALDLILDKDGTYWFIENNPNGQWAFVEEATSQPIGKAIADLLIRHTKRPVA